MRRNRWTSGWERYEVTEKTVAQHATSVKVLVPKHWIGKRVRAVRLEPENEGKENGS